MPFRVIRFSFILALAGLSFCYGQDIQVSISKSDVNSSPTRLHKIFGHDRDHFYSIKFYGNQYFLGKLDKDLSPLKQEPIKLFKGLKTYQLETVVHFYNELYVFVSRTRLNDITLYYQKISKENLQPVTDLVEVVTVQCVKGAWADFHFALSRRETKLMVASRIKLSWSKAQFNEIFVFGKGLSPVWKRKDSFEFKGIGPRDNRYIIDETGNVSILSLIRNESIFSFLMAVKNVYSVYRYTHEGKDYQEYPLTLQDRYIRGVRIVAGDEGSLYCAGLYSELYKTGMGGTFFFSIDPETDRASAVVLNKFDEGFLARLAAMREPLLRNEEVMRYEISDLVLRQNGKIILIAEQVFEQAYDTYNNLIITSLDNNGQVYWTQVIGKNQDFNYHTHGMPAEVYLTDYRQYVMETGYLEQNLENYCSYALMAPIGKSDIVIFYNDDIRNREPTDKLRNFNQPRKSYLLAVKIDQFGNMSRSPLNAWKKKGMFPEPIRFYDTRSDTLVIPAFRYRKYSYYRITALVE